MNRSMKNAMIAHKFLTGATNSTSLGHVVIELWLLGWYLGSYKKKCNQGAHKGMFEVYYKDDKMTYFQELSLDQYGIDKLWVVVSKRKRNWACAKTMDL